jgi:hypothetical protein
MGAVPIPIDYVGPRTLAETWWCLLRNAGFTVRFYKDQFGSPSTRCPPELVDRPTAYGGWVYGNEQVLAIVAWLRDQVVGEGVGCKLWTTERAFVIHYMLIASGLRCPHLSGVSPPDNQDVLSQIGGIVSLYRSRRIATAILPRLRSAGYDLQLESSACLLPEPYFVATIVLRSGGWLLRRQGVKVFTGPCTDPDTNEDSQFVALAVEGDHSNWQEALGPMENHIISCDGRRVDFLEEP